MHLLEHQGKRLFSEVGIPVPIGRVVRSLEETKSIPWEFTSPVAVKAQVRAGGRGKAGGVRFASAPKELEEAAQAILGASIKGYEVQELLIEEMLEVARELYMSLVPDSRNGTVSFMFSSYGGVDVEEIAKSDHAGLFQWTIDDLSSVKEYELRCWLRKTGLTGKILTDVASVAYKLCRCFREKDLLLAEINPLIVTKEGNVVAADAKVEVDDNALYRHDEFDVSADETTDPYEQWARKIGISYVQLNGEIGIIASGAGLAMNSMDLIESKGRKASNFLETGGGITEKLVADSMKLLLSNPSVHGVLVNLYGGVNSMMEAAKGIITGLTVNEKRIPVVVKLLGNQQEEAWSILEAARIPTVKTVSTEDAVDLLLQIMGNRASVR